jgi:hypothetical protein
MGLTEDFARLPFSASYPNPIFTLLKAKEGLTVSGSSKSIYVCHSFPLAGGSRPPPVLASPKVFEAKDISLDFGMDPVK